MDILNKKLENKDYISDPSKENSFVVYRDDHLSDEDKQVYFEA